MIQISMALLIVGALLVLASTSGVLVSLATADPSALRWCAKSLAIGGAYLGLGYALAVLLYRRERRRR